jgi:hypothetical protein
MAAQMKAAGADVQGMFSHDIVGAGRAAWRRASAPRCG